MPIFPNEQPIAAFSGSVMPRPEDGPDASALEVIGSAFRQSNTVGSAMVDKTRGVDLIARDGLTGDEVWKEIEGTRYESQWDRFAGVFNRRGMAAMKAQIDMEIADRRNIEGAGWGGFFAELGAAVIDPINLIPVGGQIAKGGTIGRMALRTSLAGMAGATVSEIALHASQKTRTLKESGYAIAGGAVIGGLLGAGAGAFMGRSASAKLARAADEYLYAPEPTAELDDFAAGLAEGMTPGRSVGAAAVGPGETLADNAIMGSAAKSAGRMAARLNPLLRAAHSPSAKHRSIIADLAETGYYLEKNAQGRGNIAVETAVKYWERGALGRALTASESLWTDARRAGVDMTYQEFREATGRAMRRGDVGENEFVSRAAASWRKELFDPLKNEAIEIRLLPEDVGVKTAASYFSRLWNMNKLTVGEARFKRIVTDWLDGEVRRLELKQEEIGIGRKINEANAMREQFDRSWQRLDSIERRLEGRQSVRSGKRADLARAQGLRFDAMKERAPEGLVRVLRGADDNAAAVEMVRAVRSSERAAKKPFHVKYPMIAELKALGGVKVGSALDAELRAMDVTPKSFPGLFKAGAGVGDVDNFILSEMEDVFGPGVLRDAGDGYVDPRSILDAIRNEAAGRPTRTVAEQLTDDAAARLERDTAAWLESVGLPANAKVSDVRALIKRVLGAERSVNELDARISRLESEIDDFDRMTDGITAERNIAESEARKISDQLDAMEKEIAATADLANASPRVKLIVDYAGVKRDLFKAKLAEQRAAKRADAIRRLDREGRASPENLAELAAKEADISKLKADVAGLAAKADKLKAMQPALKGEIPDFVSDLDRENYIAGIANDVFNTLTGRARFGDIPYDLVMIDRGPLKERTFNIPDELVEDFLDHDVELVGRRYARIMGSDVELTRKFGSPDLKEQVDAIKADYQSLRDATTDPKELERLRDMEKRDIADMSAVRDLIRGTYKRELQSTNFARVTRAAMTFNYMRTMGGVALANLNDAIRPLWVHGVGSLFSDVVTPAFTGKMRALKLSVGGARRLGAVTERVLQSRIATMAELADPYAMKTPFERFLDNAAHLFTKATLLPWLTDFNKSVASIMTQSRIVRNVRNFDTLSARERAYMGFIGIDADKAALVRDAFDRFGETVDGVLVPNADRWPGEVQRMFAAALNKDVDTTIVTKGVADVPLFVNTPAGRALMQFKGFALASHQRVLMRGLQEGPASFVTGVAAMTTMGMLVYALKQWETGRDISDNPAIWVAEGLDRSGVFSVPMEINNAWERSLDGFGLYDLAGKIGGGDPARASRYATRSRSEAILGPMAGFLDSALSLAAVPNKAIGRNIEAMTGGDVAPGLDPSDITQMRRMLPFASLPYVRWLIDGATPLRWTGFDGIVPELKKAVE